MPTKVTLTTALRSEYGNLFNTLIIRPPRVGEVDNLVAKLQGNAARYRAVSERLGVPWEFIAVIHNMEASQDFSKHLHNGDPLTARTRNVPANRPLAGSPPFSWEESAGDALTLKKLDGNTDWSLAGTLYQLERYNGFGYRSFHPQVLSPYLWAFSTHYTSGKYASDGVWSDTLVSKQCGAAVLLRRMAENNHIDFVDQPAPAANTKPLVVNYAKSKSRDASISAHAETLQRWLNTFPGIFVKIDGIPGRRTSDAYRKVTGVYLPGDPQG